VILQEGREAIEMSLQWSGIRKNDLEAGSHVKINAKAIYFPDVVATRFNPDMKAKYHKLITKGKCK